MRDFKSVGKIAEWNEDENEAYEYWKTTSITTKRTAVI